MLPQPVLGGHGGRVTLLLLSSDAGVTEKEASAATHNGISDCCSWRSCERDAGDGGWSLNGLIILFRFCSRNPLCFL